LFNYLTYFLIWILNPLPDRLIYEFIDFNGFNPYYLNRIIDINSSQFSHEITIYYCFTLGSLVSLLNILLSFWCLINSNRLLNDRIKAVGIMISGIIGGILFGFTTCLPFFFMTIHELKSQFEFVI